MHIIHGKQYNLINFEHPGGNEILDLCKHEPDCTALFESYHAFCNMKKIQIIMKKYEVGECDTKMFSFEEDGFYNTCKQRVRDSLLSKEDGTKANLSWGMTVTCQIFIFTFCQYALLFYNPGFIKGILSVLSGITLGAIGYNMLHDASHHSISKYNIINLILSTLTQALVMWNHTLWTYHHCIRHHQYTGNHMLDPDMRNQHPWLRKTKQTRPHKQEFSRYYIGTKVALFNFIFPGTCTGQALSYHFRWRAKKRLWRMDIPDVFNAHDIFQYLLSITFIITEVYYGGVYFLLHLLGINIAYFMGSAPDHDMYTTHIQIEKPRVGAYDWGELQVNHSGNFMNNYPLFTKFFGGINFQIEHHLFPSLSSHRLKKISPIVKQCCEDFNINYHVENNPWVVWKEIVKTYMTVHSQR